MKKFIFMLLVLGINLLFAQEIVKLNQEKPLNKNAGRELKLKKVLQIGDEDSEFLFSQPFILRGADDGSFYVMEFNKLFKFDAKGKPLKSLCKVGEGPGEVNQMKNFILHDDSVIMLGVWPNKIVRFNKEGNFLQEFKFYHGILLADLLVFWNNKYYILYSGNIPAKKDPYFVDIDHTLAELSDDGKSLKNLALFPVQKYVMTLGEGGWRAFNIGEFKAELFRDQYLIITHTPDYLLKMFDLKEGRVTGVFSRKYPRVKFQGGEWGKTPDAPKLEYENDVKMVFPQEKDIWVLTSTVDAKKGGLIDIFDSTGTYTDSFYLKVPGDILCIHDRSVFVCERDKNHNPLVVCYRVMVL